MSTGGFAAVSKDEYARAQLEDIRDFQRHTCQASSDWPVRASKTVCVATSGQSPTSHVITVAIVEPVHVVQRARLRGAEVPDRRIMPFGFLPASRSGQQVSAVANYDRTFTVPVPVPVLESMVTLAACTSVGTSHANTS
jgi:hypothetical protein